MRPAFLDAAPIAGLWKAFSQRVVHKGLLPFQNKQHGINFGEHGKALCPSLTFLFKPGDAEQQLIHCLAEPGLARHTEDVLSGWRHCTWNFQAITTLHHQNFTPDLSHSNLIQPIYLLATWFNLVTSTINHQARQIHVVSGSQGSPCRCRPGAPHGTVKF